MYTLLNSKSGDTTLKINNTLIHSKYNPVIEAKNFISHYKFNKSPRIIILIGSGLGYVHSAIKDLYPKTTIISIFLNKKIFELSQIDELFWIYGTKDLKSILESLIPDILIQYTSVVTWTPCTKLFQEEVKKIEKTIFNFFLERKGSIFTTEYFGKKWIRNFLLNLHNNKTFYKLNNISSTVIIAASGPSLSKAFVLIKKYRSKIFLVALPSSLAALNTNNIKPDLLFNTDPGFWNNEHFKYLLPDIPVAMPLTALFSSKLKNPIILLNQNSFLEKIFFSNKSIPVILSHGTVAGSAYRFFINSSPKAIIFAGLDFCFKDIHEHVKPHSYDSLLRQDNSRIKNELTTLYERAKITMGTDSSGITNSFSTYIGWFNNIPESDKLFRLNPSSVELNQFRNIDNNTLSDLLRQEQKNTNQDFFIEYKDNISTYPITENINLIIDKINDFANTVPNMFYEEIYNFFIGNNILNEIFQYVSFSELIELFKLDPEDIEHVRMKLLTICSNAKNYFNTFITRMEDE